MQDLYDFLMTPRNRRERTSHGAITHYGPSRRASVSPEDQQAASVIMAQMQADEMHQEKMGRVSRADQMMTGRGPEAGGKMTYGDKEGTIGPKPALTPEDRMTGLAGGMDVDPFGLAESRYGGTTEGGDRTEVRLNLQNAQKAGASAQKIISELESERMTYPELDRFEGISIQELADKWMNGELSKEDAQVAGKLLGQYRAFRHSERLWEARAEGAQKRNAAGQVQGVTDYLGEDGQIVQAQ